MKFLAAVMPPPDIYQYEPGSSEKKSGYIARGWNWAQNQSDQGTGKKRAVENLPFSSLHKQIVIHLIYFVVLWLNDFWPHRVFQKNTPLENVSMAKRWILINTARQCFAFMSNLANMRPWKTPWSPEPMTVFQWEHQEIYRVLNLFLTSILAEFWNTGPSKSFSYLIWLLDAWIIGARSPKTNSTQRI